MIMLKDYRLEAKGEYFFRDKSRNELLPGMRGDIERAGNTNTNDDRQKREQNPVENPADEM